MTPIRKYQHRGFLSLFVTGLIFAAACNKSSSPTAPTAAAPITPIAQTAPAHLTTEAERISDINNDPKLNAAGKTLLIAHVPEEIANAKQEVKDRHELVLPPPSGWKPEDVRRKLKLTLIPEKTTIHVDGRFRYRLETQNVGRDSIIFVESYPGFIKDGELSSHWYGFYVTPPGGKEKRMTIPFILPSRGIAQTREYFPPGKTPAERDAAFERMKIEGQADADLSLSLKPGESLTTRPDSPAPDKFRALKANFGFAKPGMYRIKAVYDDRPLPPPSEEDIKSMMKEGYSREEQLKTYKEDSRDCLGFVESNTILIEVVQ